MSITRELWISNLLDAASRIADKETQERRWLASDAYAWERPEELINVLFDDSCFDLFIEEFGGEFTDVQRDKAVLLKRLMDNYCDATPVWLDPAQVLADPRWEAIRESARAFVSAFKDKWPKNTAADVATNQ
jgi:hypothetical protein